MITLMMKNIIAKMSQLNFESRSECVFVPSIVGLLPFAVLPVIVSEIHFECCTAPANMSARFWSEHLARPANSANI